MNEDASPTFGATVRRERERLGIGIRTMARKMRVSRAYLSQVELDQIKPPTEDRIKVIAEILGLNLDELLALGGRVDSYLHPIIRHRPREMTALIRAASQLRTEDISLLAEIISHRPREIASFLQSTKELIDQDLARFSRFGN
jgi:transcriptional regulator with XRE-family HTH domain